MISTQWLCDLVWVVWVFQVEFVQEGGLVAYKGLFLQNIILGRLTLRDCLNDNCGGDHGQLFPRQLPPGKPTQVRMTSFAETISVYLALKNKNLIVVEWRDRGRSGAKEKKTGRFLWNRWLHWFVGLLIMKMIRTISHLYWWMKMKIFYCTSLCKVPSHQNSTAVI